MHYICKLSNKGFSSLACSIVHDISTDVKTRIKKQNRIGEETITDNFLFALSEKIPKIRYQSFTRFEEGRKTGADWEWWILYSGFSLRMRVQAKKLFPDKKFDNALAYGKPYGKQINMLMKDAERTNSIPLYIFYSDNIGSTFCGRLIHDEGVFVAKAEEVYDLIMPKSENSVVASHVLNISVAFSCFFCCALENNSPLQYRGIHDKLPGYVSDILRHNELQSEWKNKYVTELKGLNGILVYDKRGEYRAFETNRI